MGMMIDLAVQPLLVGAMVFLKDVLYDEYLPESIHLWIDVGIHMSAKLISAGITYELLIPNIGNMARIADPVMHGLMTGVIKEQFLDTDNLSALGFIGAGGKIPPLHFTRSSQGS
jgi:hypothetical protein